MIDVVRCTANKPPTTNHELYTDPVLMKRDVEAVSRGDLRLAQASLMLSLLEENRQGKVAD